MERLCPRCQKEMENNCYIKDEANSSLSYLQLIIQQKNYKKEKKEIRAAYCPNCGHLELYIEIKPPQKANEAFDNQQELLKTVKQYANAYRQKQKETTIIKKEEKPTKNKKRLATHRKLLTKPHKLRKFSKN